MGTYKTRQKGKNKGLGWVGLGWVDCGDGGLRGFSTCKYWMMICFEILSIGRYNYGSGKFLFIFYLLNIFNNTLYMFS